MVNKSWHSLSLSLSLSVSAGSDKCSNLIAQESLQYLGPAIFIASCLGTGCCSHFRTWVHESFWDEAMALLKAKLMLIKAGGAQERERERERERDTYLHTYIHTYIVPCRRVDSPPPNGMVTPPNPKP